MTSPGVVLDRSVDAEPEGSAPVPLSEFVRRSGMQSLVFGASKDPNAKITVLLLSPEDGRPVLAIKAPTTDAAARAVETERRLLVELERRRPLRVAATIPRIREAVEFDGRAAIVASAVPGTPMTAAYLRWRHTASRVDVAADFEAVETWLADLHAATPGRPEPLEMDAGVTMRLSARFDDDVRLAGDLERLATIHGRLRRNVVRRTVVHGDLWFGNLLLTRGRISGVVDWEAGSIAGEPVRDLVRFAHMYALYLDRRTRTGRRVAGHPGLRAARWGAGLEYALTGSGWFPELFRRFLERGLARVGASEAAWRDAALAGIAEVAALTDEDDFARRHLELFRRLTAGETA